MLAQIIERSGQKFSSPGVPHMQNGMKIVLVQVQSAILDPSDPQFPTLYSLLLQYGKAIFPLIKFISDINSPQV